MLSDFNFWNYMSKDSSKYTREEPNESETRIKNKVFKEAPADNLRQKGNEEIIHNAPSKKEKVKEWGVYLLDVGKKATKKAATQISNTAKQISLNVAEIGIIEESNLLRKFRDEQIKFIQEKKELENRKKYISLPWMDDNNQSDCEQNILKTKILSISTDERNFMRNPPPGGDFEFNYELKSPVGRLLLTEDINLAKMRFKLVPKKISEEVFWRNYFYRVFLLKQSLQSDKQVSRDSVDNDEIESSNVGLVAAVNDDISGIRKSDPEIVSVTKEAVIVTDNDEWEIELQKELSEFELINAEKGGQDGAYDEFDDLEREILSELDK